MAEYSVFIHGKRIVGEIYMIEKFKELYRKEIDQPMSEELKDLFEKVNHEEFNDDPKKMDELIQSIVGDDKKQELTLEETVEQLKQENEVFKKENETLKGAVLEMSNFMLGGEDNV